MQVVGAAGAARCRVPPGCHTGQCRPAFSFRTAGWPSSRPWQGRVGRGSPDRRGQQPGGEDRGGGGQAGDQQRDCAVGAPGQPGPHPGGEHAEAGQALEDALPAALHGGRQPSGDPRFADPVGERGEPAVAGDEQPRGQMAAGGRPPGTQLHCAATSAARFRSANGSKPQLRPDSTASGSCTPTSCPHSTNTACAACGRCSTTTQWSTSNSNCSPTGGPMGRPGIPPTRSAATCSTQPRHLARTTSKSAPTSAATRGTPTDGSPSSARSRPTPRTRVPASPSNSYPGPTSEPSTTGCGLSRPPTVPLVAC